MFYLLNCLFPNAVSTKNEQPIAKLTLYYYSDGDSLMQEIKISDIIKDSVSISFNEIKVLNTGSELKLKGYYEMTTSLFSEEKEVVRFDLKLTKETEFYKLTCYIENPPKFQEVGKASYTFVKSNHFRAKEFLRRV